MLFALFIWILQRFCLDGNRRALGVLLPLQLVWANSQGLFMLGPATVLIYALGEWLTARTDRTRGTVRPLIWTLIAVLAVSLITPYGWHGFVLPFKLLGRIDSLGVDVFTYNISENIPPWVLERSAPYSVAHLKWVAAASFGSFLLVLRRVSVARFLLLSATFVLALMAYRNVLLFYWVAALVLPTNLALAGARLRRVRSLRPIWFSALSIGCMLFVLSQRATAAEGLVAEVAPFRLPVQAVARMQQLQLRGRLFNSVRYGGYLIWKGQRPMIDGRLVLRSAQQFSEHLLLTEEPASFDRYRDVHDVRLVLLPTAYPDRYLGLVRHLYQHPRWTLLYTDGSSTLFAYDSELPAVDLDDSSTVDAIRDELKRRYRSASLVTNRAALHLATLLAEVGALAQARRVLRPQSDSAAQALMARVHFLAGDVAAAERVSQRLLEQDPRDVDSLDLLALIAHEQDDQQKAISLAQRSLQIDPFGRRPRQLLERIQRGFKLNAEEKHPLERVGNLSACLASPDLYAW